MKLTPAQRAALLARINGQKTKTKRKAVPSKAEAKFLSVWISLGCHPLSREFSFCPGRRWRFDFCDPMTRVAIEIEGVCYGRHGRHQTPAGIAGDCEKYNEAAFLGWTVLRLTPSMITVENVGEIMDYIQRKTV